VAAQVRSFSIRREWRDRLHSERGATACVFDNSLFGNRMVADSEALTEKKFFGS